jgi:lipoprotein-anchoring transpeptidase ErfK/SrfK
LIAIFPATMGSEHDPLPLGQWRIRGTAFNPDFHYNPALFWDADSSDRRALLPPGPNSPVGVVWIDLSRPHYGIHGTPEPRTIGRTESHGCIRLTNWDAARLAQMVRPGVTATFRP